MQHIHEAHQPRDKSIPGPLEDVEERREEGCANNNSQHPAFKKICYKQPRRCLVETVLLFEDEGVIDL